MARRSPIVAIVATLLLPTSFAMTPTPRLSRQSPAVPPHATPAPQLSAANAAASAAARDRAGLKVAASAALGSILQGFNTGVIAGALLFLVPEFGLDARPGVTGLIASSTTMGAVLGTAVNGKLCDWAGRQKTLAVSSVLFLTGGVLMGWSPDTSVLIAGRFVSGIAAGLVSAAVPTYIAECAEPSQRGKLSTLPQLCVSSGILLSYLVGLGALLLGQSWRLMLAISLLPAALQAVVVLTLPESPRWLLATGQDAAAKTALKKLRGHDDVGAELGAMRAGLQREAGRSGAGDRPGVAALWRDAVSRRALLVCSALQLFQQFCGVNAIVYFTPQILRQAGAHSLFVSRGLSMDVAAMLATALAYLPKIPSVLLASALIDSRGRRWMLLAFIPPLAVCLAVLAATVGGISAAGAAAAAPSAGAALAATAAVTLFGVFFGMSLGPLPNILAAELFPTQARAAGVSATTTVQWLSNMLVAAFFPVASQAFGMRAVLNSFAAVCVLAWLCVLVSVPETKGVALEDIAGDKDK